MPGARFRLWTGSWVPQESRALSGLGAAQEGSWKRVGSLQSLPHHCALCGDLSHCLLYTSPSPRD
eukprot:6669804-Alexandrium_andersonii.AAC.1